MADLSDEELLEAFRAGDHRAFEALVRRYQRPVLGIARRFARDEDDSEDLAQRAFINASERAGGWRGGSFKSWLFRIVVNLAKNHVRDRARFDRSDEAQEHEGTAAGPSAEDRLHSLEQQKSLQYEEKAHPQRYLPPRRHWLVSLTKFPPGCQEAISPLPLYQCQLV